MENLVTIIHVIACLSVIGLVLMQHGKGADMGAAFGSGSSGSLFGVSGSSNFLSRTTAIFVLVFFLTSIALAFIAYALIRIFTGKFGKTSPAIWVIAVASVLSFYVA